MKTKLLLCKGLLISTIATAQVVNVDVTQNECKFVDDTLFISMTLTGNVSDLDSREAVLFTPYVSSSDNIINLPQIQLNGKYKQILYVRNKEIRSRMKSSTTVSDKYVQGLNSNGKFTIHYEESVAKADWMSSFDLQIKCENQDANNETEELSTVFVQEIEAPVLAPAPANAPANAPAHSPVVAHRQPIGGSATPIVPDHSAHVAGDDFKKSTQQHYAYKGCYVAPESDAMDERNQRDLNFSLEEARVMVNINPQILSLKELFTVAMSYKEDRDMFYHIILTCVKLYPTHPIANLNAASMSIELGNAVAANNYLQIAPYESLAYKNCRGAYELMSGNIYEGMRLLKSAKADGSEEAAYNLDVFFKSNK